MNVNVFETLETNDYGQRKGSTVETVRVKKDRKLTTFYPMISFKDFPKDLPRDLLPRGTKNFRA